MKVSVAATLGHKMSAVWIYFTKLHRRFCPRDEPEQERHAACVAESRLYTHNGTKALIRHLHKALHSITHPRRFARNASYERSCFWRTTTQTHRKKSSCSSSTPHLMGHGPGLPVTTRGQSHGHVGRRCSSSSSTSHLMGSGPGRPVKTHGPPRGSGGAAHIEPTSYGPRPGPAHQVSRG